MDTKKLVFVLVLCGTACILASLGAVIYLYDLHSDEFVDATGYLSEHTAFSFAWFVGLPSALTFVAGAAMAGIGVWLGLRDSSP